MPDKISPAAETLEERRVWRSYTWYLNHQLCNALWRTADTTVWPIYSVQALRNSGRLSVGLLVTDVEYRHELEGVHSSRIFIGHVSYTNEPSFMLQ